MLESHPDEIVCPICSGKKVRLIKSQKEFDINFSVFQCRNKKCQHGFLSPLPSLEVLSSLYSDDKRNRECDRTDEYLESASQHHSNIFEHGVKPLFEKPGTMLDIGAGIGVLLNVAKKHGWDAFGIEFNKTAVKIGKEKFGVYLIEGNLYDLEKFFPKESLDLITFHHVFEHVTDPASYLKYVSRFLRPNGCILLAVPNILSDDFIKQGSNWSYLHIPAHISYFNCNSLDEVFLKNTYPNGYFEKAFQSTFPSKEMNQGEAVTAIYRFIKN